MSSDRRLQALTPDGALRLDIDATLEPLLTPWVTLDGAAPSDTVAEAGCLCVHRGQLLGVEVPANAPSLRVGSVGVWLQPEVGRAVLGAAERDCAGSLDTDVRQATIVTSGGPHTAGRLQTMLTLGAAILLAGVGRAVLRAAGVVHPDGGAWLLAAADRARSDRVLAGLAAAGWSCLSAGHVVLRSDVALGIVVDRWPEPLPAAALVRDSEPLAGIVHLEPGDEEPTRLLPGRAAEALGVLAEASPWLRLEPSESRGVVRALRGGMRLPVQALHLGLDTYGDPERLAEVAGGLRPVPSL